MMRENSYFQILMLAVIVSAVIFLIPRICTFLTHCIREPAASRVKQTQFSLTSSHIMRLWDTDIGLGGTTRLLGLAKTIRCTRWVTGPLGARFTQQGCSANF